MKNEHKARKLLFNAKTNYEEIRKKKGIRYSIFTCWWLKNVECLGKQKKKDEANKQKFLGI